MAKRSGSKSNKAITDAQALIARQKREIARQRTLAEKQIRDDIRRFKRLGFFKPTFDETKPLSTYTKSKARRLRKAFEEEQDGDLIYATRSKKRPVKETVDAVKLREATRHIKPLKDGEIELLYETQDHRQLPQLIDLLKKDTFDRKKTPTEMLAFVIEGFGSKRIVHSSEQLLKYLFYGNSGGDIMEDEDIGNIQIIRVANHNTSWDTWRKYKREEKLQYREMKKAFNKEWRAKKRAEAGEQPLKAKTRDETNKDRQARWRQNNIEKARDRERKKAETRRAKNKAK